ncbi:DUF5119 domain-containing protein [uncultured Prevotella sp.]|uniref:DUF5119 domain-containing protein n=1 Tax=uncultured Prevotella sp. TaxID=159272 RepID=UPI0027E2806D|nr:DUF5119 domain-containing protein [uncultured Prevotella sp.]
MINVMNKGIVAAWAASLVVATMTSLSSCDHKELCFDHNAHAPRFQLHVSANYQQEWEVGKDGSPHWIDFPTWLETYGMQYDDLRPLIPAGLRMHDFPKEGQSDMINMAAMGETVGLRPGEHQLLFYNNDTEYIVFDEMYSYASAKATTRTRTRSTYLGNPFNSQTGAKENTVNMPDMLYGNYNKSYTSVRTSEPPLMEVTMHPLVFKYLVRYEFSKGLEYVKLTRGALSGMAASVYLNSGYTSKETATLLYDCTMESWGAQAIITSFGVPDYPNGFYSTTRAPHSNALNLEVRLKNGIIKTFNFDVTEQINNQPQGGVIVVSGIEISDEDGKQGSSGFDVGVDGWGEFEDVVIPLK